MKSFLLAVTIEISPPYKITALSNIKIHTDILSTYYLAVTRIRRSWTVQPGQITFCDFLFVPWTTDSLNKSTASGAKYARSSVIFPHRVYVRGRLMQ